MAEENEDPILRSEFPLGRVKKIVKLDKEITRVNSEALLLISLSTNLFLQFLAEKSMEVAIEKKRKTIKIDHLRIAARRHPPTTDFLLDSLPIPSQPSIRPSTDQIKPTSRVEKPLPPGARRIDDFFCKSAEQMMVLMIVAKITGQDDEFSGERPIHDGLIHVTIRGCQQVGFVNVIRIARSESELTQ